VGNCSWGERFARKVRGKIRIDRESLGRSELRKRKSFEEVVKEVERLKKEPWDSFRNRHGDWGRDLVLWCARKHTGLTLRDLGEKIGGLNYTGVSMAIKRFESMAKQNRSLRKIMKALDAKCEM